MEIKWFFITVCVALIVYVGPDFVSSAGFKSSAAKYGLEECPAYPASTAALSKSKTIFVKSCSEYTIEYYKNQ